MSESLSLSICVPAFNEEKSLKESVGDLLQTLSSYIRQLEIIIINDGSTDSTSQVAEELAREYYQVKVIHHKINLGIGVCYRDALTAAQGNYYTWFPADHENSAAEFIQCLPYLREDTIITSHHLGYDNRSALRRLISRSYTLVLNKYFHLDLKYYNGLAFFSTSILRSIPLASNGFLFTAESLIRTIKRGYKVIELSAPLKRRIDGKSKSVRLASLYQTLKDFLCILQLWIMGRD